jgi:hypothetical protein
MERTRGRKPSPALVVSIIALVFALAGTSIAGVATISVLSKKEKKQTRKIAKDEINKAAPGLSVANAANAQNATNAQNANIANTVQNGSIGTSQFAGSIPAVRVTRTAAQSIEDSVTTAVAFDSERYDTAAMHDNATNNSRLTAPVAGIYLVAAEINWPFDPDGNRQLHLRVNGTDPDIVIQSVAPTASNTLQATTQVRLQAGDYVEAYVFQDSGGFLNVSKTNDSSPEFSMTWLVPGP